MYEHSYSKYSIILISVESVVMVPLSFLILICIFSFLTWLEVQYFIVLKELAFNLIDFLY